MAETCCAVATDKSSFNTSISNFLKPDSMDKSRECHLLASVIRSDKSLLKEAFESYSCLYDRQKDKSDKIRLNLRLLALCDMYGMLGKGVFVKSRVLSNLGETREIMKKEFARLEQMHAIVPEYVPKPLELIKNLRGTVVGYTMELDAGQSLMEYFILRKALPEWVEPQLISFIKSLHDKDFAHCDLEDCNILVNEKEGRIKAIDPDYRMWPSLEKAKMRDKESVYELIRSIKIYRRRSDAFPRGAMDMDFYTRGPKGWPAYASEKGIDKWHKDWKAFLAKEEKKKCKQSANCHL